MFSRRPLRFAIGLACALAAGCGVHGSIAPTSSSLAVPSVQTRSGGADGLVLVPGEPRLGPNAQKFMPQTWSGIHTFQSFDGNVPYKDRKTDGVRYDMVWGSSSPSNWSMSNPAILNMFYIPMTTDGDPKNTLTWWQAFHPDWILYKCDRVTPAWSQGLPMVPLDISNPDAISWQISTYANKAQQSGYTGLAVDLVGFYNGNSGCGVWVNGKWVQKFSGQKSDPAWNAAVENWASTAYSYLHGMPVPMVLAGNHMVTSATPGDPNEQQLLSHLDIDEDEAGFTNYGNGFASDTVFNNLVYWMNYAQSIGHAFFVVDKWKSTPVSPSELDWSLGTYLMGKSSGASVDVVGGAGYGYEYWFPQQYASPIGHACAKMYLSQNVYFRKFSGGLAIVNTSPKSSYTVTLPQPSYTSIEGGTVTSPATLPAQSAMVLLTSTNGCN